MKPMVRVIVAGLAIAGAGLALYLSAHAVGIALSLVAVAVTIRRAGVKAVRSIRKGRLDINVLMLLAVVGAMALGDWVEAATVSWLFDISDLLEAWSLDRARRSIRSLMTEAPSSALVRRHRIERVLSASEVIVGDVVIVRPGERVPVDGRIVLGESSFDQSAVTGESTHVEKVPGDEVFAGSVNGMAAVEIEASRTVSDSAVSRIIHMVEEAQRRRAPVQTFVESFAQYYTPAVAMLALVVAVVPPFVMGNDGFTLPEFTTWSYRALALLVVACPCALVISTPVSVVSALAAAARRGVLIKGGAHLEKLASIKCVAFDKTGTLTDGAVQVRDVVGIGGATHHGVLSVAAALESRSEHPIGRAIVEHARDEGLDIAPAAAFRALPGMGAEARVGASQAIIGSHRLFEERALCTPDLHARVTEVTRRGDTPVLVGHDGAALGVIGVADGARHGGRAAIAGLRSVGVERVVLLTGDVQARADATLREAGLDEVHADLLPEDKVRLVARLREVHGPVAMVGDGVNDAPALAAADVGVAMGHGSGVALETADVTLMADDLGHLPFAIALGKKTLGNIRMNVSIALALKLGFVILAASGMATLWMAILADSGASLLVTANGLRLLRSR